MMSPSPPKKRVRPCHVDGCNNWAQKGNKCYIHGAPVRRCCVEGCQRYAQAGQLCITHGGNKKKSGAKLKQCIHGGCSNLAQKGGVCIKHGAKVKLCRVDGCSNQAKKGGVCIRHGAKRKLCKNEGCGNIAQKKGFCTRHCNSLGGASSDTVVKAKKPVASVQSAQSGGFDEMEEVATQQQQPASTVAVADTTDVAVPSVPNMKSTCHSQVLTADSAGALYGKEQTEAARIKLRHELQCGGQCAIHALNAICQERLFTKDHFLNCAKELHSEQNKLYCREDKKRTNDFVGKNGYFEIDVLIRAAASVGLTLDHIQAKDLDDFLNCPETAAAAYVVHEVSKETVPHYFTLLRINGQYWNLDSLFQWPKPGDPATIISIMCNAMSANQRNGSDSTQEEMNYTVLKASFGKNFKNKSDNSVGNKQGLSWDGTGHFWSCDFLLGLDSDSASNRDTEITISMKPTEDRIAAKTTMKMKSSDNLDECIESFYRGRKDYLNLRTIRWSDEERKRFIVRHGPDDIGYRRWEYIPVKAIAEAGLNIEIKQSIRQSERIRKKMSL